MGKGATGKRTCENDAARQRAARSIQEAGGVRFRVGPPSAAPRRPQGDRQWPGPPGAPHVPLSQERVACD